MCGTPIRTTGCCTFGHKKGILDLTYSPEYRLLVSCGFEHEALVWSPFVKNLVSPQGHHFALCAGAWRTQSSSRQTSPASSSWDVRKFDCVQTFSNLSGTDTKDNGRLSCFEYASCAHAMPCRGGRFAYLRSLQAGDVV